MTTLESLQALTDEQLIEKVAVEVMGWKKVPIHKWMTGGSGYFTFARPGIKGHRANWNPVTDYNHAFEVVAVVEKKGLYWNAGNNVGESPYCCIWPGRRPKEQRKDEWGKDIQWSVSDPDLRRAICLAALLAVSHAS